MTDETDPKPGALRVWWIPQIPGKPWHYYVDSIPEGALLLDALADYDAFLLANNHRVDYSNAGGLEVYTGSSSTRDAWEEWETEDGRTITDVLHEMHEE